MSETPKKKAEKKISKINTYFKSTPQPNVTQKRNNSNLSPPENSQQIKRANTNITPKNSQQEEIKVVIYKGHT